jgi:hypothetical protein
LNIVVGLSATDAIGEGRVNTMRNDGWKEEDWKTDKVEPDQLKGKEVKGLLGRGLALGGVVISDSENRASTAEVEGM